MKQLFIGAIPSEQDPVWKYSSEKVPHLTILSLGEVGDDVDLKRIREYVEHTAKMSLCRFGMSVERRGELGDKDADVLFFDKQYGKKVWDFRTFLLEDAEIARLFNSTNQFDEWTPHLTMGYPSTPAKEDERDYPGFNWVNFDRIAVWTDDYEGEEILLQDNAYAIDSEMAMSDQVEKFLEHYGVPGMKWGVRKPKDIKTAYKDRKASIKADRALEDSKDAQQKTAALRIARQASVDKLSNQDLQSLVTRMNLEQQYDRLTKGKNKTIEKRVRDVIVRAGVAKVGVAKDDPWAKVVKKAIQDDMADPNKGGKK